MKITYVEVIGLNGSKIPVKLEFNEDLNIITGRNGAGKTTILKLIWYVISGNFDLAFKEIEFSSVIVETESYICTLDNTRKDSNIEWLVPKPQLVQVGQTIYREKNATNKIILSSIGQSLFFPTFRRLEGGFETEKDIEEGLLSFESIKTLKDALTKISQKLSKKNHQFIASVGTTDIDNLLYQRYSEISEKINTHQETLNKKIIEQIKDSTNREKEILSDVQRQIEALENYRKLAMSAFDTLAEIISKFLKSLDMQIGDTTVLKLTDIKENIKLEQLSAGEKQILSFLVYNTFYQDTIFIIDEPELSLHVDWQRQLFPTLMKQGSTNQFIVATHSPFIYSKYPDKELQITEDKGDNEEQA